MRSKVPQITALFWVTKLLTTAMGETSSDFLVTTYEPVVVVALTAVVFAAVLVLQLAARRYVPWLYWLTVVLVGVFGTMVADVAHVVVGIPYLASTLVLLAILIAVFVVWRRVEGTVDIHGIRTRRRELFYWAAVVTTFALGTAAGDLLASTFHLGYLGGGLVFTGLILVPAVVAADRRLPVAAFWVAYILTRPIGASFSDWLAVPASRGGLGMGTGPVSAVLALLIAACVALLTVRRPSASAELGSTAGARGGPSSATLGS